MEIVAQEMEQLYDTDFIQELVRQTRVHGGYRAADSKPAAKILEAYVLNKEQRRALPIISDPGAEVIGRVKAFHNSIAVLIEKECGLMATPFVQINHEGFGRVLIVVGKLVVMDRTLRDVHRFSFDSLSTLKNEADKYLSVALEIIGKHSDVAGM